MTDLATTAFETWGTYFALFLIAGMVFVAIYLTD